MANLNALLDAAQQHLENGAIEDAEILCRQALGRAPRSPRALRTFGLCQIATGDMEGAMQTLERVLEIDPEDAASCHNLALAQHATGNAELAQLNIERALSLDPNNPTFHEATAAMIAPEGRTEDAVRHLLTALELKPGDASIMANLGSLLAQLGAFFDARSYFEQSLKIEPDNPPVAIQLAHILHDLDDHDRGLELTESLYLKRPRDPSILAAFAHSLALAGDLDRAQETIDAALKLMPNMIPVLEEFAQITALRGTPDLGIAQLAGLLKSQRENPHLCLAMAAALARVGKHEESVTLAQPAMENQTTCANGLLLTRQGLFHLGRFQEAVELARGMGIDAGNQPDTETDTIIIPLETKPLEAILFARFLKSQPGMNGAVGAKQVYAHAPLVPLLKRMNLNREVLPLEGHSLFELAEKGQSGFIAGYAARPEMADYAPADFEPYLATDPRADDFWRGSLEPLKRPLCGIAWSKYQPNPLLQDVQAGLEDWPGTLLSLIWDDQRAELEGNRRIIDAGAHLTSLEMLVDLIGKLDLVVGPDGLVTHLAGAMGVPAIVLVTPDKPWYWYAPEGRSHWYPSVHVLERAWEEPMDQFGQRLSEKAAELTGAKAR